MKHEAVSNPLARVVFLALLFGMVSSAHAADCVKNTESCVEGPETRNIGGYPVYRDCWRYPRSSAASRRT
jgi:hypothetical protein